MKRESGPALSTAQRWRGVTARVLGASALTALLAAVLNGIEEALNAAPHNAPPALLRGLGAFIFALPYTIVGLLVLGLPSALLLRKFRAESALTYAAIGAVLGIVWLFLLLRPLNAATLAFGALSGCACALSWWVLRPKT